MFLPVSSLIVISRLAINDHYLFFTSVDAIFKTVISIYAQDMLSPLPSLEEVLICNQRTTVEEVNIRLIGTNSVYYIMLQWLNTQLVCLAKVI